MFIDKIVQIAYRYSFIPSFYVTSLASNFYWSGCLKGDRVWKNGMRN
jgi:hypothetical protein